MQRRRGTRRRGPCVLRVAVRLEQGDDPFLAQPLGCCQGDLDLDGMVGIVIDNRHAGMFPLELKPPLYPGKTLEGLLDQAKLYVQLETAGDGSEGIGDVMNPRYLQSDLPQQAVLPKDVKGDPPPVGVMASPRRLASGSKP